MSVGRTFLKTSAYATIAQLISLLVSIALSLVLPKYVSIEDYGYWQLFLLYTGYIGILHFGFNDGVYLKLGGKNFSDIDKKEYVPQYVIVFIIQFFIGIITAYFSYLFIQNPIKRDIFYFLSVYIVVENCYKILGFALMATDQMIFYSKTVIVDKVLLLLLLIAVFFNFISISTTTIIIFFIGTHIIALALLFFLYRNFFENWYKISFKSSLAKMGANMAFGVILTFSNLMGSLIISSGRLFVEQFWNIATFAKISLAVSISMFMLMFISQIGLVLFPLLRRFEIDKQKIIFDKSVFLLGTIILVCFIFFFPIYFFIEIWLPNYSESATYLVFLFPISLYEIKFTLLYTTFFKTLSKQKVLFYINLITVIVALGLYYVACYLHNIELILVSMFVAIMIRSIIAQIYLRKFYALKVDNYFYVEIFISTLFILCFNLFAIWGLLYFYIFIVSILGVYYRKRIINEISFFKINLNK
jgi:O-antigen/teichoic acid export membrane protein